MDQRQSGDIMMLMHALLIELLPEHVRSKAEHIAEAIALFELHGPTITAKAGIFYNCGSTKSGTFFNTFTNSCSMLLAFCYIFPGWSIEQIQDMIAGLGDDEGGAIPDCEEIRLFIRYVFNDLFKLSLHAEKTDLAIEPTAPFKLMGKVWDFLGQPNRDLE